MNPKVMRTELAETVVGKPFPKVHFSRLLRRVSITTQKDLKKLTNVVRHGHCMGKPLPKG